MECEIMAHLERRNVLFGRWPIRIPVSEWKMVKPGEILYEGKAQPLSRKPYTLRKVTAVDSETIVLEYDMVVIDYDFAEGQRFNVTTPETKKLVRGQINEPLPRPFRSNRMFTSQQIRWVVD